MILYFGNINHREGKKIGEPISLFIQELSPTIFHESLGLPRWKQLLSAFGLFLKYRKDINLVHIASYSTLAFYNSIYQAFLCRVFKKKYIVVVHGGNTPQRLKKSPRLSKYLYGNAHRIITPSRFLQTHLKEHGYEAISIPNFIPLEKFPFKERRNIQPNILWVRTFHKIYNTKMAARVVKNLVSQYPEVRLLMVGREEDQELTEFKLLLKELNIEKNITIAGQLKREEWVAASNQYDIFISTTNIDNTPMSLIEAMALGLPVVSTNVGGVPYLVDDTKNGLLVPPDDDAAMANAIKQLLTSPDLVQQLTTGGRALAEQCSWDVVREAWRKVLVVE